MSLNIPINEYDNEDIRTIVQEKNNVVEKIIYFHQDEIKYFLEKYLNVLAQKNNQLIYKDEYGDWNFDDWWKECHKFINSKMLQQKYKLGKEAKNVYFTLNTVSWSIWDDDDDMNMMTKIIDKYVDEYIENLPDDEDINESSIDNQESFLNDPILFEKYVIGLFKSYGWTISITKKTKEQASYLVAINEIGLTEIVLCISNVKTVGQSAVREIYSAKSQYNGHIGMIITNAAYTESARQLAESLDVYLLHYETLSKILDSNKSDS